MTVQRVHTAQRVIHATYVRPETDRHPECLLLFVTGDDGWFGTSRAVFTHLADEGYRLAGFSAPEALSGIAESERVSTDRAAAGLKALYAQAKRHLGVADSIPIIMVGFSRGASAVAFTAVHPELRGGVKGAVAIALTREADYLHASESERELAVQVDDQDRIPTLRLYQVEAQNHGFSDARDALMRDLDDALRWIESSSIL